MDDKEISPEPEVMVSQLPAYDLPKKRQKTNLENFEPQEHSGKPKPQNTEEKSPVEWERLQPKQLEELDESNLIVIGKGQKPGI